MYYYGYYKRKRKRPKLKEVKNGIKVRTKRGDLGQGWLAKAWISALDNATYTSNSFTRGRTYARLGHVLSVEVKKGSVVGIVQGRSRTTYTMRMTVGIPDVEYWKKFAHILAKKPAYAAALLAGDMPEELNNDMASAGLDLLPTKSELAVYCECSQWSEMCKHATSTSYVLAEEFDRDPLLYLKIRGIDRNNFLALLEYGITEMSPNKPPPPAETDTNPQPELIFDPARAYGAFQNMRGRVIQPRYPDTTSLPFLFSDPTSETDADKEGAAKEPTLVLGGLSSDFRIPGTPDVSDERTSLPSDPREFWGRSSQASGSYDSYESALAPSEPAALPKSLGRFPMWCGSGQFITLMEEIYSQASMRGANAYLGIRGGLGKGAPKRAPKGAQKR